MVPSPAYWNRRDPFGGCHLAQRCFHKAGLYSQVFVDLFGVLHFKLACILDDDVEPIRPKHISAIAVDQS
jgi:hypothetical protein